MKLTILLFFLIIYQGYSQIPAEDIIIQSETWVAQASPPSNVSDKKKYLDTDGFFYEYDLGTTSWVQLIPSTFDGSFASLSNVPAGLADGDDDTIADGSETKINQGSNVTITGTGTTGSPYIINSAAGGGTGFVNPAVSDLDMNSNDILGANIINGFRATLGTNTPTIGLLTIKGPLTDSRITILGETIADNPGIQLSNDDTTNRVIIRGESVGATGMQLAFYNERDAQTIRRVWEMDPDGNWNSEVSGRVTGLADPIDPQDAATMAWVLANPGSGGDSWNTLVDSNIIPNAAYTHNIGSPGVPFNDGYFLNINVDNILTGDDGYGPSWNGSNSVATKNAIYDKIETVSIGTGSGSGDVVDETETASIYTPTASDIGKIKYISNTSSVKINNPTGSFTDGNSITYIQDDSGVLEFNYQDDDKNVFKRTTEEGALVLTHWNGTGWLFICGACEEYSPSLNLYIDPTVLNPVSQNETITLPTIIDSELSFELVNTGDAIPPYDGSYALKITITDDSDGFVDANIPIGQILQNNTQYTVSARGQESPAGSWFLLLSNTAGEWTTGQVDGFGSGGSFTLATLTGITENAGDVGIVRIYNDNPVNGDTLILDLITILE